MAVRIDPQLILSVLPNYSYGRRRDMKDCEIEQSAISTLEAMEDAYDKLSDQEIKIRDMIKEWERHKADIEDDFKTFGDHEMETAIGIYKSCIFELEDILNGGYGD